MAPWVSPDRLIAVLATLRCCACKGICHELPLLSALRGPANGGLAALCRRQVTDRSRAVASRRCLRISVPALKPVRAVNRDR